MRATQNEPSSKEKNYYNDDCAKKLGHWMGRTLSYCHGIDVATIFVIDVRKPAEHPFLCYEGLDNAKTAKRFVKLSQNLSPEILHLHRLTL